MFANLVLILLIFFGFNVHASRGWYVSIGGVSSSQKHDISNYSYTQDVVISRLSSVSTIPTIPSSNIYWFAQDAHNQDFFQTYSSFATLQAAINNGHVVSPTEFNLENNIGTGLSAPSFSIVSGIATVSENSSPTNTTGGNIANGIITSGGQEVARIDRYNAGSASLYKVTLTPQSYPESAYRAAISNEIQSANTGINTQKQIQDFVNLFNGQSSKTAEVSIGYKFRPFRSMFFIAPQIDLTRYKDNGSTNTAYYNSTTQTMSSTQDGSSTQVSYSDLDLSYTASLIFKIGFEQRFWLAGHRIPFSLYGLFGASSSFRNINSIRDNAFGFKYGVGSEIFISSQVALFGEFYQIQYISQNHTFNSTQNYTGNAFSTTNGFTANLSNGGTGANEKLLTLRYPSDSQSLAAQIKTTERYGLQSRISAIKFGITYYFK